MQDGQFIIITSELLPELAKLMAPMLRDQLTKVDQDVYMTPKQLAEEVPVLSSYAIAKQIREKKYGKKYGAKGKLMAKISEVRKYNRM